ncbi:unnamed protein product [Camellia sinensis]
MIWVLFLILLLLISYSLHPLLHFSPPDFWVFWGLFLPCPSNGLFGNANSNYCLKRLLIDCPIETVSSVQPSVNTKFPFDSIGAKNPDCQLNLKLIKDQNNCVDGFVEMEGEASCSSISGARKLQNVVERDLILRNELVRGFDAVNSSVHVKKGGFDLKGKGIVNQRPRNGLRRRRKGLADFAKVLPVSYDPSHFSIDRKGNNEIECSSLPVGSGADANHFNWHKLCTHFKTIVMNSWLVYQILHGILQNINGSIHRTMLRLLLIRCMTMLLCVVCDLADEDAPIVKNFGDRALHGFHNVQKELGYEGNERNAIRILEQALEEEHAARAALYLELEKEGSAAATAADEAMAIILRLQDEKVSIEMEAWQYQRIIEEKSTCDAEEMNICKEILVRRQKEKHFLGREVEAYREQADAPTGIESIDKKEIVKDKSSVNEVLSIDKQNCTPLLLERNYEFPDGMKKLIFKQGYVEKSIVSGLQKNLM